MTFKKQVRLVAYWFGGIFVSALIMARWVPGLEGNLGASLAYAFVLALPIMGGVMHTERAQSLEALRAILAHFGANESVAESFIEEYRKIINNDPGRIRTQ